MKKLVLAFTLMTALFIGGCAMYNSVEEQEKDYKQRIAEATEYIQNKYGEEFSFIEYDLPDYNNNNAKIEFYSAAMDPENEYTNVFLHESEEGISYGDDYFAYIIRDASERKLLDYFEKGFGDQVKPYVRITHNEFDNSLNKESTLSDLYELYPNYSIWADVFINDPRNMSDDEFRSKIGNVEAELKNSGKAYSIYVYLISPKYFNNLKRYGWDDIVNAYKREWKPDGVIVRNEYDAVIRDGEVK